MIIIHYLCPFGLSRLPCSLFIETGTNNLFIADSIMSVIQVDKGKHLTRRFPISSVAVSSSYLPFPSLESS